jgi:hypothetical protein
MKESYGEGVANRSGPEPCGCSSNAAPEALDRGIGRLGIELRNRWVRGADGVGKHGRQQRVARQRECGAAPRSRRPHCMPRNSMRENREAPLPSAATTERIGGRTR